MALIFARKTDSPSRAKMIDRAQLFFHGPVHFLLMVVVIRRATVNLSERKVWMLALDLIARRQLPVASCQLPVASCQ
ncbi:MAG: hypothetical protein ACLQIB_03080 [Isosphaeraceae bacterium]